jgi:hypothetical protein
MLHRPAWQSLFCGLRMQTILVNRENRCLYFRALFTGKSLLENLQKKLTRPMRVCIPLFEIGRKHVVNGGQFIRMRFHDPLEVDVRGWNRISRDVVNLQLFDL